MSTQSKWDTLKFHNACISIKMFKIIWICLESWLLLMNMGCISRGKGFIDQQNMFYFVMEKIAIWRRHRSLFRSRLTNLTIPLTTKTWFSPVPQLMSTSSASPRSLWPKKLSPAKWKTLSRQGGCFVHFKASIVGQLSYLGRKFIEDTMVRVGLSPGDSVSQKWVSIKTDYSDSVAGKIGTKEVKLLWFLWNYYGFFLKFVLIIICFTPARW